jgi:hypothetical protein
LICALLLARLSRSKNLLQRLTISILGKPWERWLLLWVRIWLNCHCFLIERDSPSVPLYLVVLKKRLWGFDATTLTNVYCVFALLYHVVRYTSYC